MRPQLSSGSASGGFGIVGTGLATVLPNQMWVGWLTIAVGALIFLFDIHIDGPHIRASMGKRLNIWGPWFLIIGGPLCGALWVWATSIAKAPSSTPQTQRQIDSGHDIDARPASSQFAYVSDQLVSLKTQDLDAARNEIIYQGIVLQTTKALRFFVEIPFSKQRVELTPVENSVRGSKVILPVIYITKEGLHDPSWQWAAKSGTPGSDGQNFGWRNLIKIRMFIVDPEGHEQVYSFAVLRGSKTVPDIFSSRELQGLSQWVNNHEYIGDN